LASNIDNEYFYVDESFGAQQDNTQQSLFNMHVSLNYKIEALVPAALPPITDPPTPPDPPILMATAIEHLDPWADQRRAGISRKLVRDALITLKTIGVESAILKKKSWGARCPLCVSLSNKSTKTACPSCYGTTIVGGYENPYYGYVILSSNSTDVSTRMSGQVDVRNRQIIMANVPHMDVDDIIVLLRSGKRFIVKSVLPTTIQDTDVHQELAVSELTPGSIEYEVSVDPWREPCWWVTA
jgi:hypothetical protein